jgi:hypothetical protein
MKRILAGLAATSLAVTGLVVGAGANAAEAALGWGSECKRSAPYVAYTTSSGWKVWKVNVYKWFTSSLTGTKCIYHSSFVLKYTKG